MLKQILCVIWAALPSKSWCLGPALSYDWLSLLVVWLLWLQGADFTCLKEETSLWFLAKILDVSALLARRGGFFSSFLNRHTINIPDLIPGKSISHSQTIQAAQGILCPCRAAAKGCLKPAGFHSSSHTWVLSTASWIWRPDIPILVATCSPLSDSGINHQSRGERGLFKIRLGIPDPVLSLLRHSPHLLVLPSCVNPGKLQGTLKDNSSSGNEIEQHPKGEI